MNADVSPAERPQHAQNQFSRNIYKTNIKLTKLWNFDVPTHRNLQKTIWRRAKRSTLVNDISDPNLGAQNDTRGRFLRGRSNVINSKVSAHFGLPVAPRNRQIFNFIKENKAFLDFNNSSFWSLPTIASSAPTFLLKAPSESNSCFTHIKMFKKRQQFQANVDADVSPAERPQHGQNQFSRNIRKSNRKSTKWSNVDVPTHRNL